MQRWFSGNILGIPNVSSLLLVLSLKINIFFITVKWVLGLNYLDPLELLHKYTKICQSNFLY